jgi:rRNA-processing protein EBP2
VTGGANDDKAAFEKELAELAANAAQAVEKENNGEGWETDEEDEDEEEGLGGVSIGDLDDDTDSDSEDDQPFDNEAADEDDIALSDIESLASEDKEDVVPHQRLTINNTAALQRAYKSFALPASLPFLHNQTITSAEPVVIEDVEDDLNRELSFYKQSLDAVKDARAKLKKDGVPFTRPTDYFAEMVKSEEQMGKVKAKLVDEAARKKASADARRQRDLKKFGKAVQVAKLQERDRTKRDTMDKINSLKRKRAGGADLNDKEDNFDVALEDAAVTEKKDRADRKAKGAEAGQNRKRQKKDEKYGFGGKKRHAKSNDAKSSSEMGGFSAKRMKGKPTGGAKRPGKSQRAKKF